MSRFTPEKLTTSVKIKTLRLSPKIQAASLLALFWVRMLGLFLPLTSLVALFKSDLDYQMIPDWMIGLTLAAFPLAQVCAQFPLAHLSDTWGRKKAVVLGLCLMNVGSIISLIAIAQMSIILLIIARIVQGLGAIGSSLQAWLIETSNPKTQTLMMALVGVCVGSAFLFSMVLGPLLSQFGLEAIFLLIALLNLLSLIGVWFIPSPQLKPQPSQVKTTPSPPSALLKGWPLDATAFGLHFLLSGVFFFLPIWLLEVVELKLGWHSGFYALMLLLSLPFLFGMVWLSDKKQAQAQAFISSTVLLVLSLAVSLVCLAQGLDIAKVSFIVGLLWVVVFFSGFNALEALLPSYKSKRFTHQKSKALALLLISQQLGSGVGAFMAGFLSQQLMTFLSIGFVLMLVVLVFLIIHFAKLRH